MKKENISFKKSEDFELEKNWSESWKLKKYGKNFLKLNKKWWELIEDPNFYIFVEK